MSRGNKHNQRHQRPNKKQQRKKQAALVERCIKALNTNSDKFRQSFATQNTTKPTVNNNPSLIQPTGELKHFEPIRIDTVDRAQLTDTVNMLEKQCFLDKTPGDSKDGATF